MVPDQALAARGVGMDESSILEYIVGTFKADVATIPDATFFFYGAGPDLPPDHRMPFATLVSSDVFDDASDLNRPGVFRLNVGVGRTTYRGLVDAHSEHGSPLESPKPDFTALDQILPHPVYAPQSWVCVLNPSAPTFEALKPLLSEAHALAAARYHRKQQRGVG